MARDCSSKSFKSLMVAQGLDATNVNLFKLLVIYFLAEQAGAKETGLYTGLGHATFIAPYLFFSLYAGYLADRFSKTLVIRWAKVFEVSVVSVGAICIVNGWYSMLVPVLFLMALHSAALSPAKYGIMPEILDEHQLSRGNGYLEFWTLIAIIIGTAISGALKDFGRGNEGLIGFCLIGLAVLGLLFSFGIERTPAAKSDVPFERNPFTGVFRYIGEIRQDRTLYLTFLGISYFWAIGAVFQANVLLYAKHLLGMEDFGVGMLTAILGVGTGVGSLFAGKVSEGKVELGLVPIGALGLGLFATLLGVIPDSYFATYLSLIGLGMSAGVFLVPLTAYFQRYTPIEKRGRYLAANNFVTYSAMMAGIGLFTFSTGVLGLSAAGVFLAMGVLSFAVAVYLLRMMPGVSLRTVNWILSHTIYSLRTFGVENVPEKGGALLVANHVSFADPPLLLASLGRPVRFMIYKPIYEAKLIKPFARAMGAIPIDPTGGPKALMRSLNDAREAIQNGELVCIFAEGALTRIGHLLPFNKGLERIMKDLDAPIIPVYLDQLWGSIFSFRDGKFFFKRPKELPYPVTVTIGKPLPSNTTAPEVRQTIQELSVDAFPHRRRQHQLLHMGFISQARRTPFRECVTESSGKKLNFSQTAVAALVLRRQLKRILDDEKLVGVMLPPGIAGVMTNLAILISGRVPVNLNFTASRESIRSAIKQCRMTTLITSEAFIEKLEFAELPQMTFLEDLMHEVRFSEKLLFTLALLALPDRFFELFFLDRTTTPDDLATVIFSSGSTGEPKGVMLSHGNICSNLESLYEIFELKRSDVFLGVLPFFHSFGFTGTIWLPLLAGNSVVFHPNPMDGAVIGEMAEKHKASVLMSTPTFLLTYVRKVKPEQFKHLRHVIVGAEKLQERIAASFRDRFGVTPLEGYGSTELSPVAIMNVPDFDGAVSGGGAMRQTGQKLGSVGHPIPAVAVRIVDPETFEKRGVGEEGLLLVKGPNVMLGYLSQPQKTAEVIKDGWYVTGDLAKLDEDGFVTIVDRLSRFSKIAGEMVPHGKLEEEIHSVLGTQEQTCAVTALPDERKGEKLVVVCMADVDAGEVVTKLGERGLPNLWIPKKENFVRVEKLPLLGSGKLDLKGVKELARERLGKVEGEKTTLH